MVMSVKTRTRLLLAAAGVAAVVGLETGEAAADTSGEPALVDAAPDDALDGGGLGGETLDEPESTISVTVGGDAALDDGQLLPAEPGSSGGDIGSEVLVPTAEGSERMDSGNLGGGEPIALDPASRAGLDDRFPALELIEKRVELPSLVIDQSDADEDGGKNAAIVMPVAADSFSAPMTDGGAVGWLSFFGLVDAFPGSPAAPMSMASWSSVLWWTGRVRNYLNNHQPTAGIPSRVYDAVTGVVTGSLNFTDRDGDSLTYDLVDGPSFGTVVINSDGTYTYVAGDAIKANGGTDTFTVRASDKSYRHLHGPGSLLEVLLSGGQHEHAATQTVVVNILPTGSSNPDGPSVHAPVIESVTIDDLPRNTRFSTLSVIAHDEDGGPVTVFVALLDDRHGTLSDIGDGRFTYTADAGLRLQKGYTQRVLITVTDGEGRSTSQVVDVEVEKNELYSGALGTRIGSAVAVATSPDGATIYVATAEGQVLIFDAASGIRLLRKSVPGSVNSMAIDPDGSKIYLGSNNVAYVLDANTGDLVGYQPLKMDVGGNAEVQDMWISADGLTRVHLTRDDNLASGGLSVSVGELGTFVRRPLANRDSWDGIADAVVGTPDGRYLYVTDSDTSVITVYRIEVNADTGLRLPEVARIDVGGAVSGITMISGTSGGRLYAADRESNALTVIDVGTNSIVRVIPVSDSPRALAGSPDGAYVYALVGQSQIVVIDTETDSVIAQYETGRDATSISVAPDGSHVYVSTGTVRELPAYSIAVATLLGGTGGAAAGI